MTPIQKHWSLLAGILFGFALLPVVLVEYEAWADARRQLQQQSQPVITTTVKLLQRDAGSALIEVDGVKHRPCQYVGIAALTFDTTARSDTTVAQRVDRDLIGITRPVGRFYAGQWRVAVRADQLAILEAVYQCDGVPVRSLFARIEPMPP